MTDTKNVYSKLAEARIKLHKMELKRSGKNKLGPYFELKDFLPQVLNIFMDLGLLGAISFSKDLATLTITSVGDGTSIQFTAPMGSANLNGCQEIQNIGAVITYQRRYLWMCAMEILENDALDAVLEEDRKGNAKKQSIVKQAVNSLAKQVTQAQSLSVTDAIQGIQCCTTASELTDIKGMCLDFPARSDERYKAHKAFSDKIIELMGKCQSLSDLQQLEPLCKAVDQSFLNSLRNSYGQTKARFN